MSIAARRYMRRQLTSGTDSGYLPFLMPAASTLRAGRKVFAHYVPTFPRSLDDNTPSQDYYAMHYLMPTVEVAGQSWATDHRVYGGFIRTRPMPRPPIGTDFERMDIRWELTHAQEMGLDGFFVDFMTTDVSDQKTRRSRLLVDEASLNFPNFSIMLMVDAWVLPNVDPGAISDLIAYFDNKSSSYYLDDGRLLVGIFNPENCPITWYESVANEYLARYGKKIAWTGFLTI